jgi:S-adenosylmethionine decarboxylase
MTPALGIQGVVDLYGCHQSLLKKAPRVEKILLAAARAIKATVVCSKFHEFNPFGVSGVVVIAESHMAVHTWPEFGYAAVDIFTCGDKLKAKMAARYLAQRFGATKFSVREIHRGRINTTPQNVKNPHRSKRRQ